MTLSRYSSSVNTGLFHVGTTIPDGTMPVQAIFDTTSAIFGMKSTFKSINHDGKFEMLGANYFYDPALSTTSRYNAKMEQLEFLGITNGQKTFGKPQIDRLCLHEPSESAGGCIDQFGFYMVFSNNPFAKLNSVSVIGLAPKGWRTNCGDQNDIDTE